MSMVHSGQEAVIPTEGHDVAVLDWRPIATAPRDGREIEARREGFAPFRCEYDGERFLHYDPDDGPIDYSPDQWRPIMGVKATTANSVGTKAEGRSAPIPPANGEG